MSPAIRSLMRRAAEMGHPRQLAMELFKYLCLRFHAPPATVLSPSTMIDQLWHWMLLNTELAEEVYKLIGGRVHHSTASSADGDSAKAMRRLRAMNLMVQDGSPPHEESWKEPGLSPVKVPVSNGGGAFVYAYKLDHNGRLLAGGEGFNFVAQMADEMGYAGGDKKEGEVVEAGVVKGEVVEGDEEEMVEPLRMPVVYVCTMAGKRVPIQISLSCTVAELKLAVEDHERVPPCKQLIVFRSGMLADASILSDAGITDGCTVHLVLKLRGC
jgi:hypothetical protein